MQRPLQKTVHLALIAAMVFVATYFLKFPYLTGYLNLGDAMILAGATLLGPAAWIAGAVGAALSDFLLGYSVYILPTFIIKGLVGFLAGYLVRHRPSAPLAGMAFILAELVMVAGYFITEFYLYGLGGAVPGIYGNLLQGFLAVILGTLLYPSLNRFGPGIKGLR